MPALFGQFGNDEGEGPALKKELDKTTKRVAANNFGSFAPALVVGETPDRRPLFDGLHKTDA